MGLGEEEPIVGLVFRDKLLRLSSATELEELQLLEAQPKFKREFTFSPEQKPYAGETEKKVNLEQVSSPPSTEARKEPSEEDRFALLKQRLKNISAAVEYYKQQMAKYASSLIDIEKWI